MLLKKIAILALLTAGMSLAVPAQTQTVRPRQLAQAQQPPRLGTFGTEERYVLHPGDVLDIQYRYTPEFNQTVTVQPDGFISLEIGGDLKVAGHNLERKSSWC